MNSILRILINFVITAILIIVFANLTWINLLNPPDLIGKNAANEILVAGVIGSLMLIIGEILNFAYKILKFATLGIAKLIYPIFFIVVGYLELYVPTLILDGWYTHTFDFWKVIIIAIAIGLFRVPQSK